ncbi:MAG: energy transducer TonB [Candidatus Marinimicrobia bacterium]|nr:energy transducer TonB [Candidatus Neomarinimicrobiota bacterium]
MQTSIQRVLITSLGICCVLAILGQCAWFKGETLEPEITKPHPIGGYETLGSRIYYPPSAREAGLEGAVTVKVFVAKDGRVIDSRIAQKLNPELDRIALNAVQRTLFEPALKNGKPIDIWISIPIIFALKDWHSKSSPFSSFEMIVHPNPAYQGFQVEMLGKIKPGLVLPLLFECLLPFNADQTWVKTGSGNNLETRRVRDASGEWLTFEVAERSLTLGFNYLPVGDQGDHKFQYKFIMNQALPDWQLALIYGDQHQRFSQTPDRRSVQVDGSIRFEYDLDKLDAFEPRYLEIALIE